MKSLDAVRRLPLLWRLFLVEAAVLALAALLLTIGPITVSSPVLISEFVVLGAGLGALLVLTLVLLRRTLRPLHALTRTMHRIDLLSPGHRVAVDVSDPNVERLATAFNDMLARLEHERRESARMALSVQEAERRRVARELHDEVAQTLTAMLLQIEGLSAAVPDDLRDEIEELRETARAGAADVRRIAQRLRPEALDELGLESALLALATRFAEQTGVETERRVARVMPLSAEQELVVYRVAQEALTNIGRHARARRAELTLDEGDHGALVLRVRDDGRGIQEDHLTSSYGIRGMRERAMLIGAELSIHPAPRGGTEVTLSIPGRERTAPGQMRGAAGFPSMPLQNWVCGRADQARRRTGPTDTRSALRVARRA